jgi:hypothetical protein
MLTYSLQVPPTTEWSPAAAQGFIAAVLSQNPPPIEFWIQARTDYIKFGGFIYSDKLTLEKLQQLASSFWQGAEVTSSGLASYPGKQFNEEWIVCRSNTFFDRFEPLIGASDIRKPDPLTIVTQVMSNLPENTVMRYRIFIWAQYEQLSQKAIAPYLTKPEGLLGRVPRYTPAEERRLRAKIEAPHFSVVISLEMAGQDKSEFSKLSALAATMRNFVDSRYPILDSLTTKREFSYASPEEYMPKFFGSNLAQWYETKGKSDKKLDVDLQHFFTLGADEIAALWHPPHKDFTSPKIIWTSAIPPEVLTETQGAGIVGVVNGQPVYLARGDRKYHAYVTGKTGMGKSTLIHNMIDEDIAAGEGVGVIDPHGKLVNDILELSISQKRLGDVVLFRCGDKNFPVPLNPFRVPEGASTVSVMNTVMWIMRSIYANNWSETQMETVMRALVQVMLADPEATPLDVQELFLNPKKRARMLQKLQQQGVSRSTLLFWKSFEENSPSDQARMARPVLNRMTAFLGSPLVELMTCHPQTINFRELIANKKIILIDLSGEDIRAEVGSLGAIFLGNFFLATEALGALPDGAPPRFYLYVDETQRYITTALSDMFSEARKFGLSLVLANQYLGQLDTDTQQGILGNVGTKFSFECHPDEARLTARMYEPTVSAEELARLGAFRVAVRTRFQGKTLDGFVMDTYDKPQGYGLEIDQVVNQARTNTGLIPATEVNEWIDKRYSSEPPATQEPGELQDFDN